MPATPMPGGRSPILADMADPTSDDDPVADPAADSDDDTDASEAGSNGGSESGSDDTVAAETDTRKPVDAKDDVAARRAATKARMDAAPSNRATAEDPTGVKARRRAKGEAMGTASATDPTGAKARRKEAAAPRKVPRPSKRTGGAAEAQSARRAARSGNPKKVADAAESSRYTAPIPRSQLESPTWVPVLMFALLAAGMVVIFLTYVLWEGRPLALGVGLACILGGILAATQYR